jgi:hypothetical protein
MSVQLDSRIDSLGNDDRSILVLKDILRQMNEHTEEIAESLGVVTERVSPPTSGGGIGISPVPPNFVGIVQLIAIYLSWGETTPTARNYEIRRSQTDLVWETADFVTRTPSQDVHLAPLKAGTYNYLIKSMDGLGNYSAEYNTLTLTVVVPNAPTITATVIDNNVLLYWNVPTTSHSIDRFNIYRDGVFYGINRGTFVPIFETIAGTYTYAIEAVDVAGNIGARGSVTTKVNQPPDFELRSKIVSDLRGVCVNCIRLDHSPNPPTLLACITTWATWDDHFKLNAWNTIQDQINSGYPLYNQPTEANGSYEEVINYGVLVTNTIITINHQYTEIVPSVGMVIKLAYSSDGVNYSPFVVGNSQFIPSFQYLKMRLEFTGTTNKSLAEFSIIQTTLDVKKEIDSGDAIALATDVNGTWVPFKKVFKDIDSITATADSKEPIDVIYDFADLPNPLGFYVFAMDTTGNRVTFLISWKARGVV